MADPLAKRDKPVTKEDFVAMVFERLSAVAKDREHMRKRAQEQARQHGKSYDEIMVQCVCVWLISITVGHLAVPCVEFFKGFRGALWLLLTSCRADVRVLCIYSIHFHSVFIAYSIIPCSDVCMFVYNVCSVVCVCVVCGQGE